MAKGTRDVKSSHDELACALPSKGPLGCDCGPEWILALEMFGEELHYRVRDVCRSARSVVTRQLRPSRVNPCLAS